MSKLALRLAADQRSARICVSMLIYGSKYRQTPFLTSEKELRLASPPAQYVSLFEFSLSTSLVFLPVLWPVCPYLPV